VAYAAGQLAMAKLRRAGFALMMALLPASATIIGAVVLHQIPTVPDLCGIVMVIAGIVLRNDRRGQRHPDRGADHRTAHQDRRTRDRAGGP
jgi:inner membrane transporter RhtA